MWKKWAIYERSSRPDIGNHKWPIWLHVFVKNKSSLTWIISWTASILLHMECVTCLMGMKSCRFSRLSITLSYQFFYHFIAPTLALITVCICHGIASTTLFIITTFSSYSWFISKHLFILLFFIMWLKTSILMNSGHKHSRFLSKPHFFTPIISGFTNVLDRSYPNFSDF